MSSNYRHLYLDRCVFNDTCTDIVKIKSPYDTAESLRVKKKTYFYLSHPHLFYGLGQVDWPWETFKIFVDLYNLKVANLSHREIAFWGFELYGITEFGPKSPVMQHWLCNRWRNVIIKKIIPIGRLYTKHTNSEGWFNIEMLIFMELLVFYKQHIPFVNYRMEATAPSRSLHRRSQ